MSIPRLHHVLIEPKELDALKLEAKHTIDMARFVDRDELDSRYFEKPYYLLPDGDEADEGYTVLRDALAKTKKVAIGQLIMHGREHLVGITAHKKGLVLVILRYADELRKPETYFDKIDATPKADAVQLAVELIEEHSGKFAIRARYVESKFPLEERSGLWAAYVTIRKQPWQTGARAQ